MKTTTLRHILLIAATFDALATAATAKAQQFSDDPRLYGTWLMESMQFEGEHINYCRNIGYTQVKYYGKNGEYACVEFYRKKNEKGETYMEAYPYEYGKPGQGFRFKNGDYIEMGRPALRDAIAVLDANTVRGKWLKRTDIWKRIALPKPLLDHIITAARIHQEAWSSEYQGMMLKYLME